MRAFVLCDWAKRSKRPGSGWGLRTLDWLSIKEGEMFTLRAYTAFAFVETAAEFAISFSVTSPDGDGRAVGPEATIAGDGSPLSIHERVTLLPLIFPIPGRYTIALLVNGDCVSFSEFDVRFAGAALSGN